MNAQESFFYGEAKWKTYSYGLIPVVALGHGYGLKIL